MVFRKDHNLSKTQNYALLFWRSFFGPVYVSFGFFVVVYFVCGGGWAGIVVVLVLVMFVLGLFWGICNIFVVRKL